MRNKSITNPFDTDYESAIPQVAILRPHLASKASLQLDEVIAGNDSPGDFLFIATGQDIWELRKSVKDSDELRYILEVTAQRIGVSVSVNEYQLRRREMRDCYTHDLGNAERKGAFSARLITIQDPNLGQVRYLNRFMRYAIFQRLIVFYSSRDQLDDIIEDLGIADTPKDENAAFIAENKRAKIHLVNRNDEEMVEETLEEALLAVN